MFDYSYQKLRTNVGSGGISMTDNPSPSDQS